MVALCIGAGWWSRGRCYPKQRTQQACSIKPLDSAIDNGSSACRIQSFTWGRKGPSKRAKIGSLLIGRDKYKKHYMYVNRCISLSLSLTLLLSFSLPSLRITHSLLLMYLTSSAVTLADSQVPRRTHLCCLEGGGLVVLKYVTIWFQYNKNMF